MKLCKHCGWREATTKELWCDYCDGVLKRGEAKLSRTQARQAPFVARRGTDPTKREREVLCLVANGQTMKSAADQLGISHKSVHAYSQRLRDRLGATNLIQLGVEAQRQGYLRQAALYPKAPTP